MIFLDPSSEHHQKGPSHFPLRDPWPVGVRCWTQRSSGLIARLMEVGTGPREKRLRPFGLGFRLSKFQLQDWGFHPRIYSEHRGNEQTWPRWSLKQQMAQDLTEKVVGSLFFEDLPVEAPARAVYCLQKQEAVGRTASMMEVVAIVVARAIPFVRSRHNHLSDTEIAKHSSPQALRVLGSIPRTFKSIP